MMSFATCRPEERRVLAGWLVSEWVGLHPNTELLVCQGVFMGCWWFAGSLECDEVGVVDK